MLSFGEVIQFIHYFDLFSCVCIALSADKKIKKGLRRIVFPHFLAIFAILLQEDLMPGFSYAIASLLCVSLVSFAGAILLLLKKDRFDALFLPLYAFAFGTFAGNTFFFLLPESWHHGEDKIIVLCLIISGFLLFALWERLPSGRVLRRFSASNELNKTAYFTLVSDAIHSWVDGSLIAMSYMIDVRLGIITTIAIICHEIPHEIAKFALLVHQGIAPIHALKWGFLPSLGLFIGAGLTYLINHYQSIGANYLLPFVAGMFLYISVIKMLPDFMRGLKGISYHQIKRVGFALIISTGLIILLQMYLYHSH
jgi:zinc and cadmium transporter